MRVLIACEFSGIVRDAFRARGHDAVSVDVLPSEQPGPHMQQTVDANFPFHEFDLMIAHPPCTYLSNSGVSWLYQDAVTPNIDRWNRMREGARFFRLLLDAPVPRIAVENPIMHRYAVEIIGGRQTQVVQPWQFGHTEQKATCLWLKNLPPLAPTDNVRNAMLQLPKRMRERSHYESPSPDRWKARSRTYRGIAAAMAAQWGE